MEWIKFTDKYPPDGQFLYYDSKSDSIELLGKSDRSISSLGYYCNDKDCDWIYDDCCCDIVISPNDFWMSLPEKPNKEAKDAANSR